MEEKVLLNTLKYLNYQLDNSPKSVVKSECSRIFGLAQSNKVDFIVGLQKAVYSTKGKKRYVARYHSAFNEGYSVERNLAHQIVRACRIMYPNRSLMIHELFGVISILGLMMDFTIIRFDFKSYFYSIKPIYVWEKYLKNKLPDYIDKDLIESYCNQMDIAYPGLEMSNVLAEVMGAEFDKKMNGIMNEYGILYYGRFVDDGIIILKKGVKSTVLLDKMNRVLKETFSCDNVSPKCTTSYHDFSSSKFFIKTMKDIHSSSFSFSFLGYCFELKFAGEKLNVYYGIEQSKLDKYRDRLTNALKLCTNSEQCMLLLRIHFSRIVYSINDSGIDYWKERGFSSVYKELKTIKDKKFIISSTKTKLESMAKDALSCSGKLPLLNNAQLFAVDHGKKYNLFKSICNGQSLIFDYHNRIGFDWKTLLKLVKTMNGSCKNLDYQHLTKELLIKTKIGY